jgi:flagella basal body P-ring formation protein FlgA
MFSPPTPLRPSAVRRRSPLGARRWAQALVLGAVALAAGGQARGTVVQPMVIEDIAGVRGADSPLPGDLAATLQTQLERIALSSSQGAVPGVQRVEIEVGQLDPRLRLAPCQRVEPYLPVGTRLWGKARIGLRCTQGTSLWNVFLPITVKVYGNAWVAAQTLAAGAVLTAADLVQAEVDWAADASATVNDPELAVGRTLLRRVTAGQGLRLADLRPRQWFAAGDMVKVVAVGRGFAISGSGQALGHGIEGQTVRVRTETGRVVSGAPAGDRQVEIRL